MREIKFRAWLPHARRSVWSGNQPPDRRKRGRMVDFDELYFEISHDSLEHPQIFTDTAEHFYGEDIDEAARDAVLEQYTGLEDKNGVEIYEGDMLKTTRGTASVEYEPPTYWLEFHDTWVPRKLDELETTAISKGDTDNRVMGAEVVGNIHENPELLKEGTKS